MGEHSGSVSTAEAGVGCAFLLSAGVMIFGADCEAGRAIGPVEATPEGDDEPDISTLVASCSRKDSMDPFVATDTFCKNALCFAATSGSLSLADVRFGANAVDAESVVVNLKKGQGCNISHII